ncbi:MAG: Proline/betaine transporter, partial [Pseudomonadota bacterium]
MAQSSPGQALPLKQNMNKLTRQAIVAGILGNALEWYDFALYGHFSVFIGKTFFPSEQPDLALLAAFAVFSVSFCMRPIGALIFSAMGDRYGRKRALSLSMLGMAIPTAGIGLLPPYADIGVAATAILVILRLFQGLSLGGEMGGAVTYVMEHTPPERTGFASALIQASTCGGLLLGSLISGGLSLMLTDAAFND